MLLAISAHTGTLIGSNIGLALYLGGIAWIERQRNKREDD